MDKQRKSRSISALVAITKCKGGAMADRRTHRRRSRGDNRRAAIRDASF
jgi:hypothetical protein